MTATSSSWARLLVITVASLMFLVPGGCARKSQDMASAPAESPPPADMGEDGAAAPEAMPEEAMPAAEEAPAVAAEEPAEPAPTKAVPYSAEPPSADKTVPYRPRTYSAPPPAESPAEPRMAPSYRSEAVESADVVREAPEAPLAPAELAEEEGDFSVVDVFYGTDRVSIVPSLITTEDIFRNFIATLVAGGLGLLLLVGSRFIRSRRWTLLTGGLIALGVACYLGVQRLDELHRMRTAALRNSEFYTAQRGDLQFGTAQVSIPRTHQLGEIERPSVFKLEFKEDPTRHVVILNATPCSESRFFTDLRAKVEDSPRKELFVFIHGYNVTFEHAVRRTAQVAYDMGFQGAPVTYSWPSQGRLLDYNTDEESVQYTVHHLKAFLLKIRDQSGADSINLIAHSMGNRALTDVLDELSNEQRAATQATQDVPPAKRMFNEVVFAAPDVPADIFMQVVPNLGNVADRLTLYASANDKALLVSKKLKGFHRAGEAGEGLVVVKGVDTIDVSEIDLSILGHNYIGSSGPIINDLKNLLIEQRPPEQRTWLRPAALTPDLRYWIYPGSGT